VLKALSIVFVSHYLFSTTFYIISLRPASGIWGSQGTFATARRLRNIFNFYYEECSIPYGRAMKSAQYFIVELIYEIKYKTKQLWFTDARHRSLLKQD
jgi:hypothetical protein